MEQSSVLKTNGWCCNIHVNEEADKSSKKIVMTSKPHWSVVQISSENISIFYPWLFIIICENLSQTAGVAGVVGAVGKISAFQPQDPQFDYQHGQDLDWFVRRSFSPKLTQLSIPPG